MTSNGIKATHPVAPTSEHWTSSESEKLRTRRAHLSVRTRIVFLPLLADPRRTCRRRMTTKTKTTKRKRTKTTMLTARRTASSDTRPSSLSKRSTLTRMATKASDSYKARTDTKTHEYTPHTHKHTSHFHHNFIQSPHFLTESFRHVDEQMAPLHSTSLGLRSPDEATPDLSVGIDVDAARHDAHDHRSRIIVTVAPSSPMLAILIETVTYTVNVSVSV